MVDAPRTLAQLQSDFADGGSAGNETPQKVRQIFLSMPMPNIIHQTFRPEMPPYNMVPDATPGVTGGTDNTTAMKQMMTDIATRGWGEVYWPEGLFAVQGAQIVAPVTGKYQFRGKGRAMSGIQRINSSSTGLLIDVSGASDAAPAGAADIYDMQFNGLGAYSGGVMRMIYGAGISLRNVELWNSNDFGLQTAASYDCFFDALRIYQCAMNSSATAFTTGDEGGGTTIGSEALQILGAIAASGFGSTNAPNNQLRFNGLQIETFRAGAIVMATTSNYTAGSSSHDVTFDKFKIETLGTAFTGKYVIQQTSDIIETRLLNGYVEVGAASGANVGAMQGIYFSAATGNKVQNVDFGLDAASSLQSILKCWAGGDGAVIENLIHTGGQNPTNGVIWFAGGHFPDWANCQSTNGATLIYPTTAYSAPLYPTADIPAEAYNNVAGAATPGTALSIVPNTINIVTSVAGGAFVQIPAGSAISRQAQRCVIVNDTASSVSVKPPTGGTVAGGATDVAFTLAAHGRIVFNSKSAAGWV